MTNTVNYVPEWPPNWTNAPDDGFRNYSSESVLVQTKDVVRCAVSTTANTFMAIFSPVFMLFFRLVCWFAIDDHRERIAALTIGTFFGFVCLGLLYVFLKYHRDRGDYVVVNRSSQRVDLPRLHRTFGFDDIRCLQLLTGRDRNDETINNSDLNLLVEENGVVVRYHLMGNPPIEHAKIISEAMNTPLYEADVPFGWWRSSDRLEK